MAIDDVEWSLLGRVARPAVIRGRDAHVGPLLRWSEPLPDATHATVESRSGQFRASIPLASLADARLSAGRLLIDNPPTRCWLVKDVGRIVLTSGPQHDSTGARRRRK